MTRKGAPKGAYAVASLDDFGKDTAIEEVNVRLRAALRHLEHGIATGEIPANELTEAIMRLLARANAWVTAVGARRAA